MFALGLTEDGSSSVPTRTTVSPGRPAGSAKRCEPQRAQNRRRTPLPLSAVLVTSAGSPVTSIAALGTITFTVPLDDRCWQSRHQQMRDTPGHDGVRRQAIADVAAEAASGA